MNEQRMTTRFLRDLMCLDARRPAGLADQRERELATFRRGQTLDL